MIKVACLLNIKLGFMDWLLYYFIILIKQCKIPYRTLGKALLFSRNKVFCLKNWKLWRVPTTLEFNIFVEILNTFPTYQCLQKGVRDFFLFCLDLELFAKIENDLVSTNSQKPVFLITQDQNEIKKSRTPFCRHW